VLCVLRMGDCRNVLSIARKHGWDPPAVLRAAAVYRQHRDRWKSVGALHYRLRAGQSADVDDLESWPEASEEFLRRERSRAATAGSDRAQAEREAQRATAAAEQARLAELEAEWGAALDSLDQDELGSLYERANGQAVPPALRGLAADGRPRLRGAFLRPAMLEALCQSSITNHSI